MTDVIASIVVVAIVMVLVRPGSKGTTFVKNFGDGFSGLITSVIGV